MITVGIYIYPNAEVLDFSGPYEVFSTASRFLNTGETFTPILISENGGHIQARGNYDVYAKYSFSNHPPLDVLIVVGGVHDNEMKKPHVLRWIKQQAQTTKVISSICTGAFLLAQAQVITTEVVTTHWEDIKDLATQYPSLTVKSNVRWIQTQSAQFNQPLFTSAGISAGIDMSLGIVGFYHGDVLARQTAKQMEFDWQHSHI